MPAGLDLGSVEFFCFIVHPTRTKREFFFQVLEVLIAPSISAYQCPGLGVAFNSRD